MLSPERNPRTREERNILASFSAEQRAEILSLRLKLESIAQLVAQNPSLEVRLGPPGSMFYWSGKEGFKEGFVTFEAGMFLSQSEGESRYIMAHEGAHAILTHNECKPEEVRDDTGFHHLMDAAENPRVNTFLEYSFESLEGDREAAYKKWAEFAKESAADRTVSAEILITITKSWAERMMGCELDTGVVDSSVSSASREFYEQHRAVFERFENMYPEPGDLRSSSSSSSETKRYAEAAYTLLAEEVWPAFKELLSEDIQQRSQQKEISLDLAQGDVENQLRELMQHLSVQKTESDPTEGSSGTTNNTEAGNSESLEIVITPELDALRKSLRKQEERDLGLYGNTLRELADEINDLTVEMRSVFDERTKLRREVGLKSGLHLNIRQVIRNASRQVPESEQRNFERKTLLKPTDYAVSLLLDLSGSMDGNKITQTFKATVLLAEILERLGVSYELLGFNSALHQLKSFDQKLSDDVRAEIEKMPVMISSSDARHTDTGWALAECADRIRLTREKRKMIFLLSDGMPTPSEIHSSPVYELSSVVSELRKQSNLAIFGLGLGSGTTELRKYLPGSLVDIPATALVSNLGGMVLSELRRH